MTSSSERGDNMAVYLVLEKKNFCLEVTFEEVH